MFVISYTVYEYKEIHKKSLFLCFRRCQAKQIFLSET